MVPSLTVEIKLYEVRTQRWPKPVSVSHALGTTLTLHSLDSIWPSLQPSGDVAPKSLWAVIAVTNEKPLAP